MLQSLLQGSHHRIGIHCAVKDRYVKDRYVSTSQAVSMSAASVGAVSALLQDLRENDLVIDTPTRCMLLTGTL